MSNGLDLMNVDPNQLAAKLRTHRDRLAKLSPEVRNEFFGALFRRYYAPNLMKSGLNPAELQKAQEQWATGIMGGKQTPLPKGFGVRETPPASKAAAFGVGALGEAYGTAANLLGWDQKARVFNGQNMIDRFIDKAKADYEQKAKQYEEMSKQASPGAALAGKLTGGMALTTPAFVAGGELALPRAAGETGALARMLRGAAGFTAAAPLQTQKTSELAKAPVEGAFAGLILDPIAGKLQRLIIKGAKAAGQKVSKTTYKGIQQSVSKDLNDLAQETYGKDYNLLSADEQMGLGEKISEKYSKPGAASKKVKDVQAKKEKVITPPKGMENSSKKELSQWRNKQYAKLRALGFELTDDMKNAVRGGHSADDIYRQFQVAGTASIEENPEVKKAAEAIGGIASPKTIDIPQAEPSGPPVPKGAPEVVEPPKPVEVKPPEKPGEPPVKVYAPGASGVTEQQKKYMDRISELEKKKATANPMVASRLQKTIDNIKKAMGGDKEAATRVKKAEALAEKRAAAAAEQKPEGSFEAGRVVPTTSAETPAVEMIDSLKAIDMPEAKRAYDQLEGFRKQGVPEEKLKALSDYVYRQIGKKLGIEDYDSMDLEDLYNRVTAIEGQKLPEGKALPDVSTSEMRLATAGNYEAVRQSPLFDQRLKEFGDMVGHDVHIRLSAAGRDVSGMNIGRNWYDHILSHTNGDTKMADHIFESKVMDIMNLPKHITRQLLDLAKKGELSVADIRAMPETEVHEIAHTLASKLGVPFGRVTPPEIISELKREIGTYYPKEWISQTHEAYTEVLTQYFMRNIRKLMGMRYMKEGSFLYRLSEHMIESSDDPKIKKLVGWALGTAIIASGAYKGGSDGRINIQ